METKEYVLTNFTVDGSKSPNISPEAKKQMGDILYSWIIKFNENLKFVDSDGEESLIPTKRILLCKDNGKWVFEINHDTNEFRYKMNTICTLDDHIFSHIEFDDLQDIIRSVLKGMVGLSHLEPVPVAEIFENIPTLDEIHSSMDILAHYMNK